MRSKRIGVVAAGLVIGIAMMGGCSKKVAPEDLKKELVNQGMPSEQANCIVDGLVAKGVPLENYSAPSADEQTKLTQVATDCVTKSAPTTAAN
jgi:hypothetical protein